MSQLRRPQKNLVPFPVYSLYGRTCVYTPRLQRYLGSKLSDKIYLLGLQWLSWSQVVYPRQGGAPEMAFHTAALVSSYMVLHGGYTHKHNRREVCYSPELYFYHLDCHVWVSSAAMEHR